MTDAVALDMRSGEDLSAPPSNDQVRSEESMSRHNSTDRKSGSVPPADWMATRVILSPGELDKIDLTKLKELWKDQDSYVDQLELKIRSLQPVRRDQLLVMRLSAKEQEIQELSNQISELKSAQVPSSAQLKSVLVDPAINVIIQKLKQELDEAKKKMQETQEELSAWKFTPDSATGKRLMSKCRQLLQENEDIGKMISSGRLAKLENELAMQKALCEEMKKNQEEMDDFVQELDLDVEGMQSTIYFLQQQLKEAKDTIAGYESGDKQNVAVKKEEEEPVVEEAKLDEEKEEVEKTNEESEEPQSVAEVKEEQAVDESEEKSIREEEQEEDEGETEQVPLTRGRRGKSGSASSTPCKDSLRRGRPTRGQKRDQPEPEAESETSPSKAKKSPGRPKRKRSAPQRLAEDLSTSDNHPEDQDEAMDT